MTQPPHTTLQSLAVRRASDPEDWRDVSALLHEYVDWLRTATTFDPLVEQPRFALELDDPAEHYSTRDSVLYIASLRGRPVGTLAVSFHPGRHAEFKRMYVRPEARGLGVADLLLGNAVAVAAQRQCTHAWLETVRGAMDTAIAVYRRNGFSIVDDGIPTVDVSDVVVMRRDKLRDAQVLIGEAT